MKRAQTPHVNIITPMHVCAGGANCGDLGSATCCYNNVINGDRLCGINVFEPPCIIVDLTPTPSAVRETFVPTSNLPLVATTSPAASPSPAAAVTPTTATRPPVVPGGGTTAPSLLDRSTAVDAPTHSTPGAIRSIHRWCFVYFSLGSVASEDCCGRFACVRAFIFRALLTAPVS